MCRQHTCAGNVHVQVNMYVQTNVQCFDGACSEICEVNPTYSHQGVTAGCSTEALWDTEMSIFLKTTPIFIVQV